MAAAASITEAKLAVRLLHPGECVPVNLQHGLPADFIPPQPEWCWITHDNYHSLAMLMAAPAQNVVLLMRICAATSPLAISTAAIRLLLRQALADMAARGYNGYITCFGRSSTEAKLLEMFNLATGSKGKIEHDMVFVSGPTKVSH